MATKTRFTEAEDDNDNEVDDDVEECELCGDDHETVHCGETLCGLCHESVENCDCDETDEIDAAEWIARGRPHPSRQELD